VLDLWCETCWSQPKASPLLAELSKKKGNPRKRFNFLNLLMSNSHSLKVHKSSNYQAVTRHILLSELSGISLSTRQDDFVILHGQGYDTLAQVTDKIRRWVIKYSFIKNVMSFFYKNVIKLVIIAYNIAFMNMCQIL